LANLAYTGFFDNLGQSDAIITGSVAPFGKIIPPASVAPDMSDSFPRLSKIAFSRSFHSIKLAASVAVMQPHPTRSKRKTAESPVSDTIDNATRSLPPGGLILLATGCPSAPTPITR
jgi:hypothetical protein